LKFASQQKLVRCLPVIFLASVFVTIASVAQAWMSCGRVENYRPVSDPPPGASNQSVSVFAIRLSRSSIAAMLGQKAGESQCQALTLEQVASS